MLKQYFYAKNLTNFLQYTNIFTKMSYICILREKAILKSHPSMEISILRNVNQY